MRDTADHEEEWGDECVSSLDATVMSAALLHDSRCSSLVAAYRAQDLEESADAGGPLHILIFGDWCFMASGESAGFAKCIHPPPAV